MSHIGIDLGTTTTLLAQTVGGQIDQSTMEVRIVPIDQKVDTGNNTQSQGFPYLPSLAYFPPNEVPVVGHHALALALKSSMGTAALVRAVKRHMGRNMTLPSPINKTPVEISALYLQYLLHQVKRDNLVKANDQITVTVPASFSSNQRRDTLEAFKIAAAREGIAIEPATLKRLFISEPVAALLSFLAEDLKSAESVRKVDIGKNPRVLVYDMGGGTLDLTLVQLGWRTLSQPKNLGNVEFQIRELNRYNQFGGEDFDLQVGRFLLEQLMAQNPSLETLSLTPSEADDLRLRLLLESERLKKLLNDEIEFDGDEASVSFTSAAFPVRGVDYYIIDWPVTATLYQQWLEPYLIYRPDPRNALYPIEQILTRSGLTRNDVDYLLLVGGMMRFLPLQQAIKAFWGREKGVLIYGKPDQAVAQGAAVYSHLKSQHPDFVLHEPSSDAYYVRRENGFGLLLGRGHNDISKPQQYKLNGKGSELELRIFAGDQPPVNGDLTQIYPTLLYQGRFRVPLGKIYPDGTKVWLQMSYPVDSEHKMPETSIWIDTEDNFIRTLRYEELSEEK